MSRSRLLLTGFEPFGGWDRNPSAELVHALASESGLRRAGLVTAVLPVDRLAAPRLLARLLREHGPMTVVLTGLAAGRRAISLERVAVNCFREPGGAEVGRRIDRQAPGGLLATLPVRESLAALRAGGAPAEISETAGTYCCNLVLFRALQWSAAGELPHGGRAPSRAGFVHLPATPATRPRGRRDPTLPAAALEDAVARLCRRLLRA